LFQEFKKLQLAIENYDKTERSDIKEELLKKQAQLERNLERIINEKKISRKSYKAYKWVSIAYMSIKIQIKNLFGEWTFSKSKGEQFE